MGNRIKIRRKELRIKQAELAERLNISNNHMSSIENGRQKPSLDIFIQICNLLNVTPDYLLLGSMHAYNIPQDIIDKLRLCNQSDIELAGGHYLYIEIDNSGEDVQICLHNDGEIPKQKIEEKGGLRNLRMMVESIDGEFRIESFPIFAIYVTLKKEKVWRK